MADKQLDSLRETLKARLATLAAEIGNKQAQAASDRSGLQGGTDRGDLSVAEAERDLDLSEADRDHDEAKLIEAVIARIDAGAYGQCADCDDAIPASRLAAQPLALRCLPCQSRAESRSGRRPAAL